MQSLSDCVLRIFPCFGVLANITLESFRRSQSAKSKVVQRCWNSQVLIFVT